MAVEYITEKNLALLNQQLHAVAGRQYVILSTSNESTSTGSLYEGQTNGSVKFITDNFVIKAQNAAGAMAASSESTNLTYDASAETLTPSLPDSGVTAATYGDASHVSQVTINEYGIVTSASNVAISGVPPGSIALTHNHVLVGNASNVATDVAMSGDVAIVASGSTTIQPNVVTYAKMQAVSAVSKLLGSSSTTTPVQEITLGTNLSLSGTTLNAVDSYVGTVTSVAMSVPTGLSISGSPITTSGTLALTLTSGYIIPTTTEETNWNTAYTNRITSLTTTGTSGAATLIANVLNIPQYTEAYTGTVTSVSVVSANGFSGSVATSTTTPAITLTLQTASALQSGQLSSTDWTTFNSKGNGTVTSVATAGLISGGTITSTGTITTSITTNKLVGRGSPSTGVMEEITLGTNLSLSGTTLNATDYYTGTVTSVAMTVPTGLSISGSPITTSGTLALTLTAGYGIPTTSDMTNWTATYNDMVSLLGAGVVVYGDGLSLLSNDVGFVTAAANVASATILQTARNINGVSFNGSANITLYANPLASIVAGSIVAYNTLATASAITSTSGLKALQNNAGTISWVATTGTGDNVFATSPTLVTPTLGVATATNINKVAITAPATSATLTIADGKTLTASNTLTFTGTDGSSVNCSVGGKVVYKTETLYMTHTTLSPADATNYFFATAAAAAATTTGVGRRQPSAITGFIYSVSIHILVNTTLGSTETATLKINNKTAATSVTVSAALQYNATGQAYAVTLGSPFAVTAGDSLECEVDMPTFVTNPTAVFHSVHINIAN